jgi:hypothetical protein
MSDATSNVTETIKDAPILIQDQQGTEKSAKAVRIDKAAARAVKAAKAAAKAATKAAAKAATKAAAKAATKAAAKGNGTDQFPALKSAILAVCKAKGSRPGIDSVLRSVGASAVKAAKTADKKAYAGMGSSAKAAAIMADADVDSLVAVFSAIFNARQILANHPQLAGNQLPGGATIADALAHALGLRDVMAGKTAESVEAWLTAEAKASDKAD